MSRPTGGQMPRTRRTRVPADPRQGPAKRAPQDREASAPHQWPLEQLAHSRLPCPNPTANCRRFSFNISGLLDHRLPSEPMHKCCHDTSTEPAGAPPHRPAGRLTSEHRGRVAGDRPPRGSPPLAQRARHQLAHLLLTAASTAARRAWERARSRADGQPTCPDLAGKSGGQGARGSYNDSRSPISAYSASRQDGRPATTKLSPSRSSIHV